MNSTNASVSEKDIYRQKLIPFSDIPNQTNFFIDYQNNSENVNQFYPTKNLKLPDFAKKVLDNYKVDRYKLCDALTEGNKSLNAGENTFENIEKLKGTDCVAVFTGQQAGLFSGPIYTIYKALSAIKLAERLNNEGIKAVPIFWIASEDHDFEEISKTYFLDKKNNLFDIYNTPKNLSENTPVGFIEIDESIKESKQELFNKISETEFTEYISELLNETYENKQTFDVAFGKLLAKIFLEYGLIFVNASDEKLRKLSSPIFVEAIKNAELITKNLIQRDSELKEKKYHSQVLVEDDYFPFFFIDNNKKRNALRFDKKAKSVESQNKKYKFSINELLKIAQEAPQNLSPNALMRPIVQDFLFPTICYFGGGAEIAYFGQNSVIYKILQRPITPIRHRSSFTIIESKHRRTLSKYELELKNLFAGKENVLAELIEKYINPETSDVFAKTEKEINSQLDYLNKSLFEIEPTLSENLENRREKIIWHIETLRKKFHKAETLRNEIVERRIEDLLTAVLPNEGLQERTVNALYFFNLYGENFLKWLYNAVEPDEEKHQIIIF